MKTIKLNLAQAHVDNVAGYKETKFAIMCDDRDCAYIIEAAEIKEWRGYGFRQVADVIITHPAIMWGDYEDIKADFLSEIEEAAIKEGLLVTNQAGVLFVK